MTGPAIPETSSTNELKKADASVQFHVRDWTRCRVPCASPSTKRTSASIQVPFIQPDVMTPLKCAVLAFQSTAPSNSATKACASAPGPTSQCVVLRLRHLAAVAGGHGVGTRRRGCGGGQRECGGEREHQFRGHRPAPFWFVFGKSFGHLEPNVPVNAAIPHTLVCVDRPT